MFIMTVIMDVPVLILPWQQREATMDLQSLPPYCGPPDSRRVWGEPDERGERPTLRLRDYVALAVLIALVCVPMQCRTGLTLSAYRWRAEELDAARSYDLRQEIPRDFSNSRRRAP